MRILFAINIVLIILFTGTKVNAQFLRDSLYSNSFEPSVNNIIKTNPLSIIQGSVPYCAEYRLLIEHVIGSKSSLQFGGSYLGKSPYLTLLEAGSSDPVRFIVKGYRFQAEFKYYISTFIQNKKAPEGLYLAPTYSFSRAKLTDRYNTVANENLTLTYTYYCLKLGYQFLDGSLSMDTFIGAGYRDNNWVDNYNSTSQLVDKKEYELYPGHLKLLLGFNMGYAF